jgi:hypothetical protein
MPVFNFSKLNATFKQWRIKGGGGATAPPLAWSMLEAVRGCPPLGLIRSGWGVFEEVYGVKSKNVKSYF